MTEGGGSYDVYVRNDGRDEFMCKLGAVVDPATRLPLENRIVISEYTRNFDTISKQRAEKTGSTKFFLRVLSNDAVGSRKSADFLKYLLERKKVNRSYMFFRIRY